MSGHYVKKSRHLLETELSTRMSLGLRDDLTYWEQDEYGALKAIDIADITKAHLSYKGAFPYFTDALSELCSIDPTDETGWHYIRGREDPFETHFSVNMGFEELVTLATDNEPTSKEPFKRELRRVMKEPPRLLVRTREFVEGRGWANMAILTQPFNIPSVGAGYENIDGTEDAAAARAYRIGVRRRVSNIQIDFYKALFNACLPGQGSDGGYVKTDRAFYAKYIRTLREIPQTAEGERKRLMFRNPRTGEIMERVDKGAYYKMILYLLFHLSSNKLVTQQTLSPQDVINMLAHVDPGQLYTRNGKLYVKNAYDTKLFIDKASWIFNEMARRGFCEKTAAATEHCIYRNTSEGIELTIYWKRNNPRYSIDAYSSNFIEENIPF